MTDTPLVVSAPDDGLARTLEEAVANIEIVRWDLSGPSPRESIDLVVGPYLAGPQVYEQLASVRTRLVQSPMLGYDGVVQHLPPGVVFANAVSVHETSTAELTLALILAAQRGLADFVRAAERGRWERGWYPSLADRRVLLVGYGGVGRAIETRLLPFEVSLTRVGSTARVENGVEIFATQDLPELLPQAEIVIIAVPLKESTTHLVDEEFLATMSDGSLLVNIARGAVADTEALRRHATSGRLRLALDVTDPEPLPEGDPLFALSNVLISPHVGGATSAAFPRFASLITQQIERLREGREPLHVVFRT